jgi:hypothetical protein
VDEEHNTYCFRKRVILLKRKKERRATIPNIPMGCLLYNSLYYPYILRQKRIHKFEDRKNNNKNPQGKENHCNVLKS